MTGIRLLDRGGDGELLRKHCRKAGVPVDAVRRLVEIEQQHVGSGRRHGLFHQIDEVISELVDRKGSDVPQED